MMLWETYTKPFPGFSCVFWRALLSFYVGLINYPDNAFLINQPVNIEID